MITVEMDFDLGKINLDLHRELNRVGGIVKKDHFRRLNVGDGVKGPMKELKTSTMNAKGSNLILVNTGKMRKLNVEPATKQNQTVEIFPGDKQKYKGKKVTMADVGGFHQEGDGVPKREWFGITQKIEKEAVKMIELKIEREIRRA